MIDVDSTIHELDRIISRVCRNDSVLWLDRDGYTIRDAANHDEIMLRPASFEDAVTWMRLFVARTPGASLDEESIAGYSVRVPFRVVSEQPTKCSCGRDIPEEVRYATHSTQKFCKCGALHMHDVIRFDGAA